MIHWPKTPSKTHQQIHVTFARRDECYSGYFTKRIKQMECVACVLVFVQLPHFSSTESTACKQRTTHAYIYIYSAHRSAWTTTMVLVLTIAPYITIITN